MSKVVAFVGSPHTDGRTAQLVNEVVRGARDAGNEVMVYYASNTAISPCRGCFSCSQEGICANMDGMQPILSDVKESNAIILGSPIFLCQASSQAKMFLDRLLPLTKVLMGPSGPVLEARYPTKVFQFAYTHNIVPTEAYSKYYEWMHFSLNVTPGAWDIKPDLVMGGCIYPNPPGLQEVMEKAYEAGKALI